MISDSAPAVRAYAKINLGLRILGRKPDGYHRLESLMQVVGLYDQLSFELDRDKPHDHIRISCDHPAVPSGPQSAKNIVHDAAALLSPCSMRVNLQKHIPVGAGLGGGSSDASAVLGIISRYFYGSDPEDMVDEKKLGSQLGSDVPFFIRGGSQIASSKGEVLCPVSFLGPYLALILVPPIVLSTSRVYRRLDDLDEHPEDTGPSAKEIAEEAARGNLVSIFSQMKNDLEKAAFSLEPDLRMWRDEFSRTVERPVAMSGSGSSLYCIYDDPERGQFDMDRLMKKFDRSGPEIFLSEFISSRGWHIEEDGGKQ